MLQDLPDIDEDNCYQFHHKSTVNFEKAFQNDSNKIFEYFLNSENPFGECEQDLVNVALKIVVNKESLKSVWETPSIGIVQKSNFIEERLVKKTKSIHDHIKMNKLPLLNTEVASKSSKGQENIKLVKADCQLFSNLYIASQSRVGDLDHFFALENHAFPVSLSEYGKLHVGTKSDFLDCLESIDIPTDIKPKIDAII